MLSILIIIILFLLLSAFFSGSEIAYISADKLGLAIKKGEGDRRSGIISKFYESPKHFLGAMLVGNNIALIVFTIFCAQFCSTYFFPQLADGPILLLLNTIISTVIVLLLGEFLPKTLCRLYANRFIHAMAYPLRFFTALLFIPTRLMTFLSNTVLKFIFRTPMDKIEKALNRNDLAHFIDMNLDETDSSVDKEILTNALSLDQQKVRDIMIPRTEVIAIEQDATIEDARATFLSSAHSRIIVMDEEIENVCGYIHHQQLFSNPDTIEGITMEIPFVPEAMNLKDLMLQFMTDNVTIACTVDEFGGVVGIVTLEDILEEIFGEIVDEHDEENFIEIQISEEEYLFSGRMEIDYINEKYEALNLPKGDYQTLSGYIVMTSGTIPAEGDEIELSDYLFRLEQVSETKIETVRIKKIMKVETDV